jgi:hypothetical protein
VPLLLHGPPFFLIKYPFDVYHPVNGDDNNLLPHASDFSVAWQFSQRELFYIVEVVNSADLVMESLNLSSSNKQTFILIFIIGLFILDGLWILTISSKWNKKYSFKERKSF